MLNVIRSEMRDGPMFLCEVCQKRIEDVGLGMVAYDDVPIEYEGPVGYAFLHKGECDKAYKGGHSRPGGWVELAHFLIRLCYNTGLKTKDEFMVALEGVQDFDKID